MIISAASISRPGGRRCGLLAGDIALAFFAAVGKQARARPRLSPERYTYVDGTLSEASAGLTSVKRPDPAGAR